MFRLNLLFKACLIFLTLFTFEAPAQAAHPFLEVRGGYGFLHRNYGFYGGTYAGLVDVAVDLKVNLGQPYFSLMVPVLFEVLLGTGNPSAYSGYGGVGFQLEPWPRITGRPFIGGGTLIGYGSDGATEYGMGYSAYGEAGIAIGKVTGISFLASYRLRWTQTGVWLGIAHEILAGLVFQIGR